MLTSSDVYDRTLGGCHGRKSTAALRMTVQLRNNDLANFDSLMESLSLLEARLAYGAVHDED